VDAHDLPVRMLITAGTTAACTQAGQLIKGIDAEHLTKKRFSKTLEMLKITLDLFTHRKIILNNAF
jgi:hypothetical protein